METKATQFENQGRKREGKTAIFFLWSPSPFLAAVRTQTRKGGEGREVGGGLGKEREGEKRREGRAAV